jgi:membrane protein
VFFILAGIAAAGAIQHLHQRVFEKEPRRPRDTLRAVIWLALVVGWSFLGGVVGAAFYSSAPILWWLVNIPAFIGFWWLAMWFLLAGRVGWRRLLPCAVVTGAIGVVFALMSFFIAIGVVITLGAAVGMMWRDRGLSFGAAIRKLRRTS